MRVSDATSNGAGFASVPLTDAEFATLREVIFEIAGISLGASKRQLVASRLARRLRHLGHRSYAEYADHVLHQDRDGTERQQLINAITTNKTSFFREPHHFEFLRSTILDGARRRSVRIWSAGCSTGEEPYSIAMTVREVLGDTGQVKLLATDIDTDVLEKAAAGVYDAVRIEDVPEPLRKKYFLRGRGQAHGTFRARPELRRQVTFDRLNLTAPVWNHGTGFDAIFCRNVIIYFDRETQHRLMRRFAEHLAPGGYLILGHAENLHGLTDIFEPLGETVYRLRDASARRLAVSGAVAPTATLARRIIVGEVFVTNQPARVSTLLGSCVSACLHDPVTGIGGMNHFLLPEGDAQPGEEGRYGTQAMDLLIDRLVGLGANRRRLVAKAFGGASVLDVSSPATTACCGNAAFVRQYLQHAGIPLVAERMGGTEALEVHFEVHTGRVLVRPAASRRSTEAVAREEEAALLRLPISSHARLTPVLPGLP